MLPAQVAAGATTPLAGHLLLLPHHAGTRSRIQGKPAAVSSPARARFPFTSLGSRGAFSAPKIPPNSLPGAESSSTHGGLENAQGFGQRWEQTPPSNSHRGAWIRRDAGLGGLSTSWRGAGGGQRDSLPHLRDTAGEKLPSLESNPAAGSVPGSSVLATAFPISSQEPPGPSHRAGAPQKSCSEPCSGFSNATMSR